MNRKNSVPKPLQKGVVKVPVVMQLEMTECGAASLCMVCHYYHKWLPLEQVRTDCGVSRDGSNAKSILSAARSYGFSAQGWKVEPEDLLKDGGPFPCIIHWGFNHFVVLCGFKGKKAIINDPARGRVNVEWEEFDKEFTGVMITLEPTDDFIPQGKKKSPFEFARELLKGSGTAVTFVALTTTISGLLGVISPVFGRVFIDRLLSGKNPEWLTPFMWAFSALIILSVVIAFVSKLYSNRIEGKMSAVGSSRYLWQVLRLPMSFFSQRIPSDIADRQITNSTIASVIVNTVAPLAINFLMMIFYIVVMIRYNFVLSLIGIGSFLLNIFVSSRISARRVNITRVQQRDSAKLSGATMSGISMIETIKSSGAEKGYFAKWSGYQAAVNRQNVTYARADTFLSLIPTLISSVANLFVLGLGVRLVIEGEFTIGSVMAFQGFLSSFMSPAESIIGAGRSVQEMTTQMERIQDVMSYPQEEHFNKAEAMGNYEKLSGNIEINNITFGYSRLAPPQIKNFSMTVEQGKKIAFVGKSGCGKSTLAKLISGLYEPWSGSITFDGKSISAIDRNVFCGSVAVIDQEVTLFDDSISANIKMWDDCIEDFEMILAARDASIHDDIMNREGGYQHRLSEGGRDISGGQRQRIEIARALAQDPTICILDEATSALDAKTEFDVVNSITNRGITCIVIAHRLSTIRDCDEILVLDKGIVVERGTHEELMAKGGAYTGLVSND